MGKHRRVIADFGTTGKIPIEDITETVSAIHVLPFNDNWVAFRTGTTSSGLNEEFTEQGDAIDYATEVAVIDASEAFLHKKNGEIIPLIDKKNQ